MSDRLPNGRLLGTDVSQLPELLTQKNSGIGEPEKAMVMTRATVWKQKEQEAEEKQLEEECGVVSSPSMKEEQKAEAKANVCDEEEEK